ncbi:flavin reductase family protein [Streptomyces sp. NPDC001292]|uniref:flavin reductase family protein n=1 Tax=Streptomyces sp. NPDC001292 TaxID=3364558 RepID=UPI00368A323D
MIYITLGFDAAPAPPSGSGPAEDNVLVDSPVLPFSGLATTGIGIRDREDAADNRSLRTSRQFQQGIQHLASGVTVVTSSDDDGHWYGVTSTSVCPLGIDPPALVVCVHRRSGIGRELGRTKRFCVNILSREQRAVAEAFAGVGGVEDDRFDHGHWSSGTTGSPVLAGALSSFECVVDLIYGYPDRLIVIGNTQFVTNDADGADPLVYVSRQYGRVRPTGIGIASVL